MADLGEGPGGWHPPLFWVKKEEMTEGEKNSRASKSRPPSPPFAQGMDPPLMWIRNSCSLSRVFYHSPQVESNIPQEHFESHSSLYIDRNENNVHPSTEAYVGYHTPLSF